jgi:acyl-CoA synthetase (NDP forming)/RimJ/RimL family protein N-acetyltransferase
MPQACHGLPCTLANGGESMTDHAPRGRFALLADGTTVEIREATAKDADDVRAMHERLSPANSYFRFFSFSPQAPEREARRLTRPPAPDHASLLALLAGELVGVASFETTGKPGVAEVAFAVADEMHGRGVATLLLEHLVSLARHRHLTAFEAETLPENMAMLRVFAEAGLQVKRRFVDGVVELTMPLPSPESEQFDSYLDAVAGRASRADIASLRSLLQPGSVAVVGAGRHRGSVGREILHNIVAGGYRGQIYPVNSRGGYVEGLTSLSSPADLPADVDVALIAVPAADVAGVAEQCGQRGVRALAVISAGLGDSGADLLEISRRYGMRLVGPNCYGLAVPGLSLNASFARTAPLAGEAGLVVQSGGIGMALLEHLGRLGIGVSSFVSVGDKYDVSSNDMLTWWEQDEQTTLAILYLESYGNPRGFARTARRVGRKLPVLTVVGGRSAAGRRAAESHTAASGPRRVTQEALFGQAGIIATHSLGELVDAAAFLAAQPLPAGRRVAIVSNAGGAGALAADACVESGLIVTTLGTATQELLTRLLPSRSAVSGPVDTTGAVGADAFRACLEHVADDDEVDALLAIGVPTAAADLTEAILTASVSKPVAAALLGRPESVSILRPAGEALRGIRRVPVYGYPESAARALAHAAGYREWRDEQPGAVPELEDVDTEAARTLIAEFLAENLDGGSLTAAAAAELLACYGIAVVITRAAGSADDAVAAAAELGGPVVVKAEADGVVHKSRAGAVRLDLRTPGEVAGAFSELAAAFGDRLRRVLVQPMLAGGVETIVGVVAEPVFGPLVVFGLGGVASDVLGDRAARLAPLTDADAAAMIGAVRAAPLLMGQAGGPAVDTAALAGLLLRVSRLADDLPEVAELDLNPVIARPDGAYPVDVRVRVAPAAHTDPFLRQLR